MTASYLDPELEAYLDEVLPVEEMARIERAVRDDPQLGRQLAEIIARRDSGMLSLGAIWRRYRLSCPTRQELGSYLLGVLPDDTARYLAVHLEVVGCRYCQANVADLKNRQAESPTTVEERQRKYFQSSAGRLRRS